MPDELPDWARRAIEAQGKYAPEEIAQSLDTVNLEGEPAPTGSAGGGEGAVDPESPSEEQLPLEPRIRLHRNRDYDDLMTLLEARSRLADEMEHGPTTCPACGCLAHVAKRSIHTQQAVGLIAIFRSGGADDYVDTARITHSNANADVAKSKWWGLIEELPEGRREDGGRSGWWKLTPSGRSFVLRETTVVKYAHVFNNEVLWRSGPLTGIEDCLRNRFDWRELMYG